MKETVGICLNQMILERVDRQRELVKRSTFINQILKKALFEKLNEAKLARVDTN